MRAVVTRVLNASVTVDGEVVGSIGHGLLALIGLAPGDSDLDLQYVADKLLRLKLFEGGDDGQGQWKRSVTELGGEIQCVSRVLSAIISHADEVCRVHSLRQRR